MVANPLALLDIKPDITNETLIIISNNSIIALSKVFFFISQPFPFYIKVTDKIPFLMQCLL